MPLPRGSASSQVVTALVKWRPCWVSGRWGRMVGAARRGQEQMKGEIVTAATSARRVSLRFMMGDIGMHLGNRRGRRAVCGLRT